MTVQTPDSHHMSQNSHHLTLQKLIRIDEKSPARYRIDTRRKRLSRSYLYIVMNSPSFVLHPPSSASSIVCFFLYASFILLLLPPLFAPIRGASV